MAKLYFRYGAMNCGKSTQLLQVAYNYDQQFMKVLLIKPKVDTKGSRKIVSRLGVTRQVDLLLPNSADIYVDVKFIVDEVCPIHCILVDEAQFLTSNQVDQLLKLAVVEDIPVICYGLRTDFQLKGFEGSMRLLSVAHEIEEIKSVCSCGKKASVNARFIGGNFTLDGQQVMIDDQADVDYQGKCYKCYEGLKNKFQNIEI